MADQNTDPFGAATLAGIYERGMFVEVPASRALNGHDQKRLREEAVPKDRPNPFVRERPRAEVLADLAAQRAEAAEFVTKADRVLRPQSAAPAAVVDAFEGDDDDYVPTQAEPWFAPEDEAA